MSVAASMTKTVVVADDTAFVRERFGTALTEAGHQAVLVQTAGELLARVRTGHQSIDLLVVDLRLPQSRGADLIRAVRQYDGGRLPILVFSGTITSADEVRELASLGVAGYVNEYTAVSHILPCLAPHLFPDSFNRRSSQRVNVAVAVSYRHGHSVASALTLNVGKGGLAVRTMTPLPEATELDVRFRLPGGARDIDAVARVCWADRHVGMGLQFERIATADQSAIDEFVDGHFFTNRRA